MIRPAFVCLLVLAVGCAASGAQPAKSEPAATVEIDDVPEEDEDDKDEPVPSAETRRGRVRVGRPARSASYTITVQQVVSCEPKYDFSKPSPGTTWLGTELVIEGVSSTPVWANPSYATVADVEGKSYRYTYAATKNCEPMLRSRQLEAGAKSSGWVVFEVPENARGFTLAYDPAVEGASEKLEIDLGR